MLRQRPLFSNGPASPPGRPTLPIGIIVSIQRIAIRGAADYWPRLLNTSPTTGTAEKAFGQPA